MGDTPWRTIRAFFQVDWAFMKEAWTHEGIFWVREFILVVAALYVASHVIKRRPFLSRVFCYVLGHVWILLERDQARWQSLRGSEGDLAGSRCECRRCGEEWNDLPERAVRQEPQQAEAEESETSEEPLNHAISEMQQEAHRLINSVFPPQGTPAAPGVTVTTTRVTRTTTSRTSSAVPKKKAAAATPKKRKGQRPTRFDRDVFGDEDPTASASAPAAAARQKPADTSNPSAPSEPEGSEPS